MVPTLFDGTYRLEIFVKALMAAASVVVAAHVVVALVVMWGCKRSARRGRQPHAPPDVRDRDGRPDLRSLHVAGRAAVRPGRQALQGLPDEPEDHAGHAGAWLRRDVVAADQTHQAPRTHHGGPGDRRAGTAGRHGVMPTT